MKKVYAAGYAMGRLMTLFHAGDRVGETTVPAGAAGASLVKMEEFYKPSTDGVLIYFTSPSGDVDNELARVEQAGGKLLRPKTHISDEYGNYGLLLDTEGNRIAFHSRQ